MNTNVAHLANDRMEAVKIASDRYVAFGHEVVNFGRKAVVIAAGDAGTGREGMLIVQGIDADGKQIPGNVWAAAPHLCR